MKARALRWGTVGALFANQVIAGCSGGHSFDGSGGTGGGKVASAGQGGAGEGGLIAGAGEGGVGDQSGTGESAGVGPTESDAGANGMTAEIGGAGGMSDDGVCPNGKVERGEECDDNNSTDGDGCTGCSIDENWTCRDAPSTCLIDECLAKPLSCSFYGQCSMKNGSYICSCKPGYSRNKMGSGAGCLPTPPSIVAGSSNTCVLSAVGMLKCWGSLNGTKVYKATSVAGGVGLPGATQIIGGEAHSCFLVFDGSVSCWGANNEMQTGDPVNTKDDLAFSVPGLSEVVQIGAGEEASHSCAVLESGTAKCWGGGVFGQLGDGMNNSATPVTVKNLSNVVQVAAGYSHTCALLKTGEVQCWGDNQYNQLGDGTKDRRSVPKPVSKLTNDIVQISAGSGHTCALTRQGKVECWGLNEVGALGLIGADGSTAVLADLPSPAKQVSAGNSFSCALLTNDKVSCWGFNVVGQVGKGSPSGAEPPNELDFAPETPIQVATGNSHACVLFATGKVKCWGSNDSGQLGYDLPGDSLTPVNVVGLP